MFDSFLITRKCPTCKTTSLREVQTKAFSNILARYRVGDVVEGAPLGEFWLKEDWWCEKCREEKKSQSQYEHPIYLYLVDGLFIGAFDEDDYKERRKRALDTYEVMRLFYKTAKQGTERKFLLIRIYHLIEGAIEHWKTKEREKREKFFTFYPKNKDALLNEILEMIRHQEGSKDEESLIEDFEALSSPGYLKTIEKARKSRRRYSARQVKEKLGL